MAKVPDNFPHFLKLADTHLQRVQSASWESPEWIDIGTFGLYCLEALVKAVALKIDETTTPNHWEKVKQAKRYSDEYKLPDIADLMTDLNAIRKAHAYGDSYIDESRFNAQDIADKIQNYFDRVSEFCGKDD